MRMRVFLLILPFINVPQCSPTHGRTTITRSPTDIVQTGTYEDFLDKCDVLLQVDKPEYSIKMEVAMKERNISQAWIPVRKHNFAHLTWLDGSVYDYEAHSGIEHYDCGILHVRNQFIIDTRICHQTLLYLICDLGGNTPCNNPRAKCVALKGKNFAVFKRKSTWYTARDYCKREGYQLASISEQLIDPLLAELQTSSVEYAWIGLRKAEFVILSHNQNRNLVSRTLENSNWNVHQPQTCRGCSCAFAVVDDSNSLKWSTRECHMEMSYICGWDTISDTKSYKVRKEYDVENHTLALGVANIVTAVLLLLSWIYICRGYHKYKNRDDYERHPLVSPRKDTIVEEESPFSLDKDTLKEISKYIEQILNVEQREENRRVMLSTFIKHLPDTEKLGHGQYLSLVLCDKKNFTLSIIDVSKEGRLTTIESDKTSIPNKVFEKKTKESVETVVEKLFKHIADAATNFIRKDPNSITGIGFTCALPCRHDSLNKAVIYEFTKDISVPEEDMRKEPNVADMLQNEIEKQKKDRNISKDKENSLKCLAVISDTSDCFMSCAYTEKDCVAAVVLDTGTNACFWKMQPASTAANNKPVADTAAADTAANKYFFKNEELINTEWGAFGDSDKDNAKKDNVIQKIRQPIDVELDEASSNTGKVIFEKMVSGLYIGELCHRLIFQYFKQGPKFTKEHCMDFDDIEMIVRGNDDARHVLKEFFPKIHITMEDLGYIRKICRDILRRSAQLAAAGITAVLRQYENDRSQYLTVAMAGRLWSLNFYEDDIRNTVKELLPYDRRIRFVKTDHRTGKGAALVASIVKKQSDPTTPM